MYFCCFYALCFHYLFCSQDVLESCIETCKFPAPPIAICRLHQSVDHQKAEIYYTDRDFKVTPSLPKGITTKG